MNLLKKKQNGLLLLNGKRSLIFLLAFMIVMLNMQITIVKALGVAFDYEEATAHVSGFGTHTVTQTVNGETLIAVSTSENLRSNNDLSSMGGNIGSDSLATDYENGSETSIQFSLASGKAFDLVSINLGDWSSTNENIIISSIKGSIVTGPILDTNTTFNVATQGNASFFKGINSFTITAVDSAMDGMAFDDITLDNITAPITQLQQVTNVALSDSGVATWDDVSYESGYEVQLYKGGNPQGTAVPVAANTSTYDFLSVMRSAGAGVYTFKVTAKGDGTNYSDGPQSSGSAGQTIAKLPTVNAGLTWSGDIAHWTTVANAASYDVQLYKNGTPLDSAVNVLSAGATSGADFSLAITANGGGIYTYKVTAKADTSTLFLDGDQSVASNNNIKAITLAQVTNVALSSTGVASWDNVTNESNFEVQLYKDGTTLVTTATKSADTLNHNFLTDMRGAGVGVYTVKVTAKGNGTTYSDGVQSAASESRTIIQLDTVTDGLTWAENVAHWTAVGSALSYDVQLYKDGSPLGGAENILAADAASGADFSSAINGMGGTYTYKVTAKGDGVLLLDAAQSAASDGNLVATPLAQVANAALSDSGVASWDNVANESGYEVQLYKDGTTLVTTATEAADTLSHDFLADMRAAGAGVYTVKVTAKGDGTTYSDGPQSLASAGKTIAKLGAVNAGLTWSGDVAHWTSVANAASYDVQLYNNGIPLNSPQNVLSASSASGVDFSTVIAADVAANNGGTYTYKVTAKADSSTLFLDGNQSIASNNNIKATTLAQVTNVALSSTGVASWDNVTNESNFEVQLYKDGTTLVTTATKSADMLNHNFITDMRGAGVGVYTVKVTAKGNGTTYSDGVQSAASAGQTITQLTTVSAGLTWTGDVAHWDTVPGAVSYDVQLYKDGNPLNSPVNVLSANTGSGADFSSAITGIGGTYTYKVMAKGDGVLLLDAAQSAVSNGNLVATPLAQVVNAALSVSGVASWDNVANESNFEVKLYKDGTTLGTTATKAADTLSHDFLSDMRAAGAGIYTVKVTAKGDGTNYSDGPQSVVSSGQTIARLGAVTGLTWTGDVAHWTAVANAVSYDVQLYKDGTQINQINVSTTDVAIGADFGVAIAAAGNGTYTYKVTAKSDLTSLFLDGDLSAVSNDNIKAPVLAIGTTNPPAGTVGVTYSGFNFNSSGGTGTKSYAVTSGSLPAGLSLAADGTLTGTPTTTSSAISFTVTVTDSAVPPVTDSHLFTMTINAAATFSLTYTAGANGSITGTTSQAITLGESGTAVTAVPNAGYHFVSWSDGVATATRTDSNVTNNINVTANFAADVISGGGGGGGTTTSSKPSTSATGNVVDNKGQSVKGIPAQVITETNGTKTVTVKAAEAVSLKQPNGEINALGDTTKLSFLSVASTDSKGTVTFKPDGTIEVSNLANGTETKFDVTYDLGNGQKLVIGKIDVKVSSNGTASLTSSLIDPYGIITDSVTGTPIEGVNVTLYYANTDRNIKAGKTPDTVVPLPGIEGFKPNNNKNPQISDISGAYGWMVFPTSDYYIVAEKGGYYKYISPTISVEQEIVKWDFRMNKRGLQINGVNRLFGQDRIDTALSIAKAAYPNKVQNIVLASSKDFPDALGGAPLAHKLNAPLVLVGSSDVDKQKALDFIKEKMDATGTVYILGGYGSISNEFEGAVVSKGFKNVKRIGGADRYETSVKIAKELKPAANTPVIIANGESFADALSISSIAAMNGYPILLVQKDGMTDAVKAQLKTIVPGKVFIVGLQGAVGTSVEKQITDILGTNQNLITRIGGADRYETSLAIAKYFKLDGSNICIASGSNFPDAVAGSIYSANLNSSIILVGSELTQGQVQYLTGKKASGAAIFGGEGSVSKSIEGKILQILAR